MSVHDVSNTTTMATGATASTADLKNCGLTSLQTNWPANGNGLTEWPLIPANHMGIFNATDLNHQPYNQMGGDFYGFYPYSYPSSGSYQNKLLNSNPETVDGSQFKHDTATHHELKSNSSQNTQKGASNSASQNIHYNYNFQATIQVPSSTANSTNFQTFTTQKMSSATTKLSYTPYQLELLNSIYKDMKYPNSVQKTLVAKRIGITRDQVKVRFLINQSSI